MTALAAIYRRELGGYFETPTAYVFLAIFLFAAGGFAFHLGGFFEAERADLSTFFVFHPWLYLVFLSAVAMRLWSEEIGTGAVELLLSQPIPLWASVAGKFLAAWTVAGVALAFTFPIWITVNYLGAPDNGAIAASYLGSFLMAGGYVAVGAAISALSGNQVIVFVVTVFVSFLLTAAGLPLVVNTLSGVAPAVLVEGVAFLSPLERFESLQRGVIDLRDVTYFLSLIAAALAINALIIDRRRGG
ncbi:MAG: ABC transporter permease [Caulobacterales bacterium]|nr:ABC transporter permease [Caulobacterales bacterium]